MTDQGIVFMESLLEQVKADLNYCRRYFRQGGA
jgi:hypothetical protein